MAVQVEGPVERQQLRACRSNYNHMLKYQYQMELLLENIFPPKASKMKKNPTNWMFKMTNVVGGIDYQHPHADQGWGLDYDGETTYPFVATHGFGIFLKCGFWPKGRVVRTNTAFCTQ